MKLAPVQAWRDDYGRLVAMDDWGIHLYSDGTYMPMGVVHLPREAAVQVATKIFEKYA